MLQLRSIAHVAVTLFFFVGGSVSAATVTVTPDGDLQAALNAAQPGDVILLTAGATYTGNFVLPEKDGSAFIVLRTGAAPAELPAAGVRITPETASRLARLASPSGDPALATARGAHHWRIENVEFLANAQGAGEIIALGSGTEADAARLPHDLILDRVYVHGDAITGQKRGIALNSGAAQILNSYIADIKSLTQDAQAIAGWNGTGPYLIENNYLEASGENILFGGADPAIWNLVPSDITIRRNLLTKRVPWRREKWRVKNLLELKNARRVLVEGNVLENNWTAAQNGIAVLFTPRNQQGHAPWPVVEDVTFQYNVVRHAGGAFNISGFDDAQPSGQTSRIRIANNVIYDIDAAGWGGAGAFLLIGHSPRSVTIDHNTSWQSGNIITAYGRAGGVAEPIEAFVLRDNILRHNKYGIVGDSVATGLATLAAYFPGAVVERNVLAGAKASAYPAGTLTPAMDEMEKAFVDAAAGNFTLVAGGPFAHVSTTGGPAGAIGSGSEEGTP